MNVWDFVILGIIALAVAGAILSIRRQRKKGGSTCGYGCEGCQLCDKGRQKRS